MEGYLPALGGRCPISAIKLKSASPDSGVHDPHVEFTKLETQREKSKSDPHFAHRHFRISPKLCYCHERSPSTMFVKKTVAYTYL